MIIGQQDADDMGGNGCWAVAEARFDQIAAEITVHAVVGPARNVAGIAVRIDFLFDRCRQRSPRVGIRSRLTSLIFRRKLTYRSEPPTPPGRVEKK